MELGKNRSRPQLRAQHQRFERNLIYKYGSVKRQGAHRAALKNMKAFLTSPWHALLLEPPFLEAVSFLLRKPVSWRKLQRVKLKAARLCKHAVREVEGKRNS